MKYIVTRIWATISDKDVAPGTRLHVAADVADALIAAGSVEVYNPLAYITNVSQTSLAGATMPPVSGGVTSASADVTGAAAGVTSAATIKPL
jgi:hypothetical protein